MSRSHAPLRSAGRFITLEGPDGSGKSTQLGRLEVELGRLGHDVVKAREPGGTPVGEAVRKLLLGTDGEGMSAVTEVLLFCAARAELVADVVAPALAAGRVVLCDRFADATMAYQGYGRGVDIDWIDGLNAAVVGSCTPDLTVLLDLPVEVGLQRRRGPDWNRLDGAGEEFHRRVREGYLEMARSHPVRWVVIPAHEPPDTVARRILQAVTEVLPEPRGSRARDGSR